MMPHAFPREAFQGLANLVTRELERVVIRRELIQPFGIEIRVVRLALQSADLEPLTVKLNNRLGLDAAQHRRTVHQVVERDRRRVWPESQRAADQPVVEYEVAPVGRGLGGGVEC